MLTDRDIAKSYLQTIPTLTERERSEALFALIYHVDPDFHHGTSGNLAYDTIAKLLQENFRLQYDLMNAENARRINKDLIIGL